VHKFNPALTISSYDVLGLVYFSVYRHFHILFCFEVWKVFEVLADLLCAVASELLSLLFSSESEPIFACGRSRARLYLSLSYSITGQIALCISDQLHLSAFFTSTLSFEKSLRLSLNLPFSNLCVD
jgi:hypothetical protein